MLNRLLSHKAVALTVAIAIAVAATLIAVLVLDIARQLANGRISSKLDDPNIVIVYAATIAGGLTARRIYDALRRRFTAVPAWSPNAIAATASQAIKSAGAATGRALTVVVAKLRALSAALRHLTKTHAAAIRSTVDTAIGFAVLLTVYLAILSLLHPVRVADIAGFCLSLFMLIGWRLGGMRRQNNKSIN
jgi:hypothetical protein